MTRRSGRIAAGGKQHKRALSSASTTKAIVKRPRKAKSTPTKSDHFPVDDRDHGAESDGAQDEEADSGDDSVSDFEKAAESDVSSLSSEADTDADDGAVERRTKADPSRRRIRAVEGVEWKPGVKTGLGMYERVLNSTYSTSPAFEEVPAVADFLFLFNI